MGQNLSLCPWYLVLCDQITVEIFLFLDLWKEQECLYLFTNDPKTGLPKFNKLVIRNLTKATMVTRYK